MIIPVWLISEMGWLPSLMSTILIVLCIAWYHFFARGRVERYGAVHHVFERLGRVRSVSVDKELRTILGEKGLLEEDLYEEVIAEAPVLDYTKHMTFENIVRDVCSQIAKAEGIDGEELYEGFVLESRAGLMPLDHGIAAPNMRHHDVAHPRMVLVRSQIGIDIDLSESFGHLFPDEPVRAFVFLVERRARPRLPSVAQIATTVDAPDFLERWMECEIRRRCGAAAARRALPAGHCAPKRCGRRAGRQAPADPRFRRNTGGAGSPGRQLIRADQR